MDDTPRRHAPLPAEDDWQGLARRLGIDLDREPAAGPARGPLAGPTDEAPLDKMIRLSTQMEQLASEIASLDSATYRAQLWQQWDKLLRGRPEYQAWQRRVGPAADSDSSPFV